MEEGYKSPPQPQNKIFTSRPEFLLYWMVELVPFLQSFHKVKSSIVFKLFLSFPIFKCCLANIDFRT